MPAREVQILLDAVRRRLWRGLVVAAVRRALWGSAALLLLATAATPLAGRVSGGAVVIGLSVLWALLLAWAAARRPTDSDCALWADRHLGGVSAFTTLLELDRGQPPKADSAAIRRLMVWSTKKVPSCMKALAELHDPVRLARPLLSALVCAALAALVLRLPHSNPAPVQKTTATSLAMAGEDAAPGLGGTERSDLANDIAKAARTADFHQGAERREDDPMQAATLGRAGASPPSDARAPAKRVGPQPIDATPMTATLGESFEQVRADRGAGTEAASGREAGSSLDGRAGMGRSQAPQGTIAAQGHELKARQRSDERQADLRLQGRYDETLTSAARARLPPATAVVAATPPTAAESSRLTSTETSYVQAWMKANAQRR